MLLMSKVDFCKCLSELQSYAVDVNRHLGYRRLAEINENEKNIVRDTGALIEIATKYVYMLLVGHDIEYDENRDNSLWQIYMCHTLRVVNGSHEDMVNIINERNSVTHEFENVLKIIDRLHTHCDFYDAVAKIVQQQEVNYGRQ